MKKRILVISAFTLILFSCTTEPICECFETRLKIKELLRSADGDYASVQASEEYKELKRKRRIVKIKLNQSILKRIKSNEKVEVIKSF